MSLKGVYEKHYVDLVNRLPMTDATFMARLTPAGFFSGDLKAQINVERTPAEKATKFLEGAITPYMQEDGADVRELLKLLNAMDKHGGIVKRLADNIKADLSSVGIELVSPVGPGPVSPDGCNDAIMKNYEALTTINPDPLLISLYASGVITYEHRQVMDKTLPLPSQKMEYIINNVIKPDLKIGRTTKFKGFLQAMEKSDDTTINTVGSRLGRSTDFP